MDFATMDFSSLLLHRFFVVCADVAAISILLYDYLLTLHLELAYVWRSNWTLIKALFLVIRYMPFASLSFVFLLNGQGLGAQECVSVTRAYASLSTSFQRYHNLTRVVMVTFCTGVGELILTLRTWAICGRTDKIAIAFLIFFLLKTTTAYILEGIWWTSLRYVVLPSGSGYNSGTCVLVHANKLLWGCWACVAIFETVATFLLATQAFHAYKSGGLSKLAKVVYSDGLMYYVYLMVIFICAAMSIVLLPSDMIRFLSGPTHAIHMSLTARVILHARKQAHMSTSYETPSTFFTQSY